MFVTFYPETIIFVKFLGIKLNDLIISSEMFYPRELISEKKNKRLLKLP